MSAPAFKTIEVVAKKKVYKKDSNGRKVKDENGKNIFTLKTLGQGKCRQYEESQVGLDQAVKDLTVMVVVKDLNRQIKTDTRNGEARPEASLGTQINKVVKTSPENAARIAKLLADIQAGN